MPRTRTPVAKADVSGAAVKNPQRHRDRKELAKTKLGAAPKWFTKTQAAVWEGFIRELPWLTEADRALMEMVAPIRAEIASKRPVGITKLNLYRLCLAQIGGSPADRSKVSVPEDDREDPGSEFFN